MAGITCIDQLFNTTSFHLMVKYREMPREERRFSNQKENSETLVTTI